MDRSRGAGLRGRGLRLPASTGTPHRCRTRGPGASPTGVHALSRTFDAGQPPVGGQPVDGAGARGRRDLRAARRHLHPRGDARRRRREAGLPGGARHRLRGAAAGQRVQRHPQLGLRRRALVCRPRGLRRARGVPALRRRRPRRRPGRHPGRGVQPPRPQRQLPAAVRAVPASRGGQHLGRLGQPRRPGLRRGPPLHPGQRRDVAAGLPRRRPAARCRARLQGRARRPPAGGLRRPRGRPSRRKRAARLP